jgi:hypothetical protein
MPDLTAFQIEISFDSLTCLHIEEYGIFRNVEGFYQMTLHNISEGLNLHLNLSEGLKTLSESQFFQAFHCDCK